MSAVKCPECGEGFDEKELHWVTYAEGGIMYRLPCDHMVISIRNEGVVTYRAEHARMGQAQPSHDPHHHHPFWDNMKRFLGEKAHGR